MWKMTAAIVLALALGGVTGAEGAEPTTLAPYSGVISCLHAHGISSYQEFCVTAAADFDELAALFEGGYAVATNPGDAWEKICARARNNIHEGKRVAFKGAVGKQLSDDALKWFRLLDAFWVKMEVEGYNAFVAKLSLEIELAHRNASITRNAQLKKDYKVDLDFLDDSYGYAVGLRTATSEKTRRSWFRAFKKDNHDKDFLEIFQEDIGFAFNITHAAIGGVKNVNLNMVAGLPEALGGGEAQLKLCVVENEEIWFASFTTARNDWIGVLDHLGKTYKKAYDKWLRELTWITKDEMLKDTEYLQGCTWSKLGPWFAAIYEQIK